MKTLKTQVVKWLYTFDLEFKICRTIKRDANLVGPRKIECSSIKTKSKERHSSTSRARRIVLYDLGCRKSRRTSELMTYVGSDDVRRKSRHLALLLPLLTLASEVPTRVGTDDVCRK